MTLPSFWAAAISSGVMVVAGGAAAARGDANTVVAAAAPAPFRRSRLENLLRRIARFLLISTFLRAGGCSTRTAIPAAPDSARAADGARLSRLAECSLAAPSRRAAACRRRAQPYSRGCCPERHSG